MALTERQQVRSWRATERLRMSFKIRILRYMRVAFKEQIKPLLEFFDNSSLQPNEYLAKAEHLIKKDSFVKAFKRTYTQVGPAFAERTNDNLKSGRPADLEFKAEEALLSQWQNMMIAWVKGDVIGSRITSITGESLVQALKIMTKSMEASVEEGLGISETSIRMRSDLNKGWGKMVKYRADRIARTELISASNRGSLMGAQTSTIEMDKTWISALQPGRTRSAHLAANGEIVGLNEKFTRTGESLDYPGDPVGSPGNVINCRCSLGYIPKEDEELIE